MQALPRRALSRPAHGAAGQRGFSMIETALVVLLVGSAMAIAFLVLRAREPARQVQAQEQALRWADDALLAYAARNAALPCAVATPASGLDDCVGPGEKGWLPLHALQSVHPGGDAPARPMRYMVYRGDADSDLAAAANRFNPRKWDGEEHALAAINGLDLCAALSSAAEAGMRGDRARTTNIHGNAINVAYGLSIAGPTPGENGAFDGLNAQSGAIMEAPARGVDSAYDDRVRVRDFQALARSLGCSGAPADPKLVLASVDLLALAVDVSDEVDEQHEGNIEDTELAVILASVSEALAVVNVALAAANISNSVSTLGTASAQLSGAIASCAVLVGCALIPVYTAAVTAAGVAIGLSSVATGLAATALGLTTAALAVTIIARDMARAPVSRDPQDLTEMIESTCMSAEGGFMDKGLDADGKVVDLVPPQWKDGLKQEVEKVAQEIVDTKVEIAKAKDTLHAYRDLRLPGGGSLINIFYNRPTQGSKESDEDYKKRYDQWLAGQDEEVAEWEEMLRAKLDKIEEAEQARVEYKLALQARKDAQSQRERMQTAIMRLLADVADCDANPPPDLDEALACENKRNSLVGLVDCESEYTGVVKKDGYLVRQCLPDVTRAEQEAQEEVVATWNRFRDLQYDAGDLPTPPLHDYVFLPGCSSWTYSCNLLIIPMQDFDDDDRETYAGTYYKLLELQNLLVLKEQELEEKKAAYEKAKAQCEALMAMDTGTGNGETQPPVWSGAAALLEAGDCRGATGPVQPAVCPSSSK